MATRTRANTQSRGNAAPTRQRRQAQEEAPAPRRVRKAAPAPQKTGRDLTQYQDYEPSAYHKAFATWLVKEVGVSIRAFESTKTAFLQGVALATAARPAFNDSEFLEEWREKNGVAKRGPKPKVEEPEDEDFEDDEDDESDESDEIDEDDDDFEDDEDDDSGEDDGDFEDEEEEEPAPAPKRGPGRPRKAAPAAAEPAPARRGRPAAKAAPAKAAPAKATRTRATKSDDFAF